MAVDFSDNTYNAHVVFYPNWQGREIIQSSRIGKTRKYLLIHSQIKISDFSSIAIDNEGKHMVHALYNTNL